MNRRDVIKKAWIPPIVLKFGTLDSYANPKIQQGATCGESIIRYGPPCGIRNGQQCEIERLGQACHPERLGQDCRANHQVPIQKSTLEKL